MWFKSSCTIPAVAAISFCFIGVTVPAAADILHVPHDFPTIQAGIDAAVNGDEVVVADGVYTGLGNRDIDFNGKLITVRSENGPDNCIINCQGSEANPHRGFYLHSGENADAVVAGFTITNGFVTAAAPGGPNGGGLFLASSPTVTNCVVSGNTALGAFGIGGGMFIDIGSPVISDCTFTGNMAGIRGGGIYLRNGSMTVTNCTFQGNSTPVIGQHAGGAIWSRNSNVVLIDCDLHENEAFHGGAVAFAKFSGGSDSLTLIGCSVTNNSADVGGGVFVQNAAALLIDSTLIANQVRGAIGSGGGIFLLFDSSVVFTNTTISANSAIEGGGVSVDGSSAVLTNATISANSASEGGGVWVNGSSVQFTNTTISANSAIEGGGVSVINSTMSVRNGILWDNSSDQISGAATVVFSNVQGGWPGTGNIDVDPLFVDPDNGDYRLSSGSPCIDAGVNIALPKGIETDLDGNPRFVDDPCTDDTGFGDPPIVDMGAYEFQVTCPWDLDCNDSVGVGDLLLLLANWGNPYGVSDLLALLANWGPCP